MSRSSSISSTFDAGSRVGDIAGNGLARLAGLLRQSWRWIAIPTSIAGIGALAFVGLASPLYTGEATILLRSREAPSIRAGQERGEPGEPADEQAVARQVRVVMSRDLAREAIRSLKLAGNAEFDANVAGFGPLQRVLIMIGLAGNPLERAPQDRMLDAYFDRLAVHPTGNPGLLAVEFQSNDPELAARAANTVAELYLATLDPTKTEAARFTSASLDGTIEALRTRVAEAEAKVDTYRARNGLIASGRPPGAQQRDELSAQLSQAQTAKADLANRAKLIREMIKDGRVLEIPDVANSETIRRAVEQRIAMRGQLTLESRTLLPAHPHIKELTAQISDLDVQIRANAERVARTFENDARIAETRIESLNAAVEGQRATVSKGNFSQDQLIGLEREANAQRDQLEGALLRAREASTRNAERAAAFDASLVTRAVTPETPSFPRTAPIVTLAVLLALLLSAGHVILRHRLAGPDSAGRGRREESAEEPAIASQPFAFPEASLSLSREAGTMAADRDMPTAAMISAPHLEMTAAAIELAPLAAERGYAVDQLIDRLGEAAASGGRAILIAETGTEAAFADLAVRLAETLASRAPTLLLDLNGPACGPEEAGLTDLVAGEADFLDVIQSIPGSRLHVVPRGFLDPEILVEEPQGLAITLDALAAAYDWVVCRLGDADSRPAQEIMSTAGRHMSAVVVGTDADPDDAALVALCARAESAGAGQVLVARDRTVSLIAASIPDADEITMPLRLSAA